MTLDRTELRGVAEDYVRKGGLAGNIAMTTPGDTLALLNLLDRAERSLLCMGAVDLGGELWKPPTGNAPAYIVEEKSARTLTTLRADLAEETALREKLTGILDRVAVALKGPPSPLSTHDWSDLPKLATAVTQDRDHWKRTAETVVEEQPGRKMPWIVLFLKAHGPCKIADIARIRGCAPGGVQVCISKYREHIEDDGKRPRTYRLRAVAAAEGGAP